MKYLMIVLALLLALGVTLAVGASRKQYTSSEKIPADTAVAFPVDI
jgi:uncharacterized membrane protein YciS (DUF1049 family)